MKPRHEGPESFRLEHPRQKRIYKRLPLIGPGPAAFYLDACRLMGGSTGLESATHLVAHLFREIESALRDVLETISEQRARQTTKRGSQDKHEEEIRGILRSLEIPESDPVARLWLGLAGKGNAAGLPARAHRDSLSVPRSVDMSFRQFWDEAETILDLVLEKLESRYLSYIRILDELLAKSSPNAEDLSTLRNHIPNSLVAYGYFFETLPSPSWLEPLQKEGFFCRPPEPEVDDEKGTIRVPPWPQSRYLIRMAPLQPHRVLEIALDIETANPRVQEDLVEAALEMPAELAAQLTPRVLAWVQNGHFHIWPDRLGDLIGHLARGDQADVALCLAEALLKVFPGSGHLAEARGRFDGWHYERILEKNLADLVAAAKVRALTLLCELLETAVNFSRERPGEEESEDYSYIWRCTIEGKRRRGFHEFRDLLVSAVRDAAAQIVGVDRALITSVIDELERRPLQIFRRIALHVLRFFPDSDPELARSRVMNRELFEDRGIQREYALLLRDRFHSLQAAQQGEILSWIERGPDLDEFRESRKAWGEQPPSAEDSEAYAKRWRLKRLRWIRESLPAEWEQRYEDLLQEFGEPADPEAVPSREAVWVGPQTPKSEEELRAMPSSEVIAYLKSWRPPDGPLGPSIDGLGRQVRSLVSFEPSRFVQDGISFRELDPTYVRALLEGLHDAVAKKAFAWQAAIDLCLWVVTQPREIEGRAVRKWDADRDWGATRAAIGRLLSTGLQEGESEIPLSLRDHVWQVLRELTKDPEPTPQYEREFGGTNMDPVTMSINTVRGEAMHTVVRYALWVRRHIAKAVDAEHRIAHGFEELSEVREVLEAHLDPSHDPSLAIRAVYGEWLPWLILLDRAWTTDNLSRIFPDDESQRALRDAAWEAYIVFCQPYDDVFEVLKGEYARAVERIGTFTDERRHLGDPDEHLAEHLMVFYWRGKLELANHEALLQRFYAKASDSLRAHALEFVGRSWRDTEGAVEVEILERLRSLWQMRLDAGRRADDPTTYADEMAAFGWWLVSGKFEDSWAVKQLLEVLSLAKKIDPDWLVLEKLATLAEAMPKEGVQCISLMIEGDLEGWKITSWRQELRAILSTIIRDGDTIASHKATDVVHRLGAKGYLEFRDLLSPGDAT